MADRWGRVTPHGVSLSLRLTHELLADLIAVQRPSVTLSLQQLERQGRIARDSGKILLLGQPPFADGRGRGGRRGASSGRAHGRRSRDAGSPMRMQRALPAEPRSRGSPHRLLGSHRAMVRRASEPVRAVLLAAALIVAYLTFSSLVTLLVTLVIIGIVAMPLAVAADWFEHRGMPRALGAFLALLAGLGLLGGALAVIIPSFVTQAERFIDEIPQTFAALRSRISDATGENESEVGRRIQEFLQGYADEPIRLIGPAAQVGLGVVGVLATTGRRPHHRLLRRDEARAAPGRLLLALPARRRGEVEKVLAELRAAWVGWLRGVGIDMLVSGVLLYIGLTIIGLDFALVFAVLSALLVVIPYFGSVLGGIPPILIALADSPGKALLTLVVYLVVQQIEGNVILPVVMSRYVSLHPAMIVIGVVVVGQVVGFLGLFVAVPIISAIVILIRALWIDPLRREDERRAPPADTGGAVGHGRCADPAGGHDDDPGRALSATW
jgi:predicted PurR-regulated permease PerM